MIHYTRIDSSYENIKYIFDEHSQEIYDLLSIMNVKDGFTFNLFPDEFMNFDVTDKIIYIDRIELVNDKYKGLGYGKCLIQRIIDNMGSTQTKVICKPFPLQWEKKDKKNIKQKTTFEADMKKVTKVYEIMNFRRIGKSEYYGRNEAFEQPKMKQFCKFLQDS